MITLLRGVRSLTPLTWRVLGIGLVVTAAAAAWVSVSQREKAFAAFDRLAGRVERELERRFTTTTYGLKGVVAAMAAQQQLGVPMSRAQFRAYVEARRIDGDFPGVRGFGYIEPVLGDAVGRLELRERADGAPSFRVHRLDDRAPDPLYVIRYIEPLERNRAAVGLDVGSESRRRGAIERAIDSGAITLTPPVTLVQDGQQTPGFLIYAPVYRGTAAAAAGTAAARRASVEGIVYAPVVARELLANVTDVAHDQLDIALYDGDAAGDPKRLVFQETGYAGAASAAGRGAAGAATASRFAVQRQVRTLDRVFTVRLSSTPLFEAGTRESWAAMVLAAGLLLTALLARLVQQSQTGRARAEALAANMTTDLDRLAMVARRTTDAVVITDAARRITWVNEGFERLTGYAAAEVIGRSPGSLVQFEGTDRMTLVALRQALAVGGSFRGELLNRAKDGRTYWVAIEIQPIIGADGWLQGYMAIESDISERRRQARELGRQRTRLAQIIEGTAVGTWEWNVETGETVFNERWAQMLGQSLDALAPTTIETWKGLMHADDLSRFAVALEQHFNGDTETFEWEGRMRHRDGHWVWVADRGRLFSRSDDGRPRWMAGTRSDISGRKAAEAALRSSQELLDRTGEIAGVGGWDYDLVARTVRWTDQTCRIHDLPPGHCPTVAEALGFFEPEARPQVDAALRQAMQSGQPVDLELPLRTARGRRIWVRAAGQVQVVDGRPARVVGALQDITERRALEQELRQRHTLLASVLENLPCGLSVFDGEQHLVASNQQYRQLLGFPDHLFDAPAPRFEDFIRHNALRGEYGPGDVEDHVARAVARASGVIERHQFERVRPDGVTLDIRGAPMPGGGFVTTYTNVTERRLAAQVLAERERLMRLVIDCFPGVMAYWDTSMRCTLANRAYREWLGLDPAEMVGRSWREIVGEAQFALDAPLIEAALHGEVTCVERSRTTADGRAVHYLLWFHPDRDGEAVRGYVTTTADVTEIKATQMRLQERTAQAEEASVAKSQFLANMSHEIRTPMNAILGMLALLRRTELTARQADYAAKTEGAAKSLLGLLNDILDFSKVEAGKMTLDPQPFVLGDLMADLSVIFSASVGAKPVEVLFDLDPALPRTLVGDALRLQQVLINLGGNAIKFTASGEVVVSVRVLGRDRDAVRLGFAVRDTGIGIAPENHARIFSGFTQAEASTTRRYGGTGLGVAISQRIVSLMGGALGLDSAVGQGSRFHFEITLAVPADAAAPAAVPHRRVLVVDDNPTAREVLARTAASLGWSVAAVDGGPAALECAHEAERAGQPFDAIFVDWNMPGMDGFQTVRELRRRVGRRQMTRLVMVTAHGREELARRSAEEQDSIDGFIVKPATAGMLARALQPPADAGAAAVPRGSDRRLDGIRLLLAEDNANNQQVACELLQDEGAHVQVAGNGREAVEAVTAAGAAFDLVLMDLQMPVMDGLEATRRLRGLPQGRTLPIVAMTANAMSSDKEACLSAGMNAHVGKPFDLDRLVGVILAQLGRAVPAVPASAAAAAPEATLAQGLRAAADAAGVELEPALARLGGRRPVYRRMLDNFVGELAQLPADLDRAACGDDGATVARLLHTAKGVAATLGASALAAAFAAAERAVKDDMAAGDTRAALAGLAALTPTIETGRTGLAALARALAGREEPAAAPAGPSAPGPSQAVVRQSLQRIVAMLRDHDLGAMEVAAALQAMHGLPVPGWLQDVASAIEQMDFARALARCEAVLADGAASATAADAALDTA